MKKSPPKPAASKLPADHPAHFWRPFPEVWRKFAERHPELAVGTTPATRTRFIGRHHDALVSAGVLVRTPGGQYLGRADRFPDVAWSLVTGLKLPQSEAA